MTRFTSGMKSSLTDEWTTPRDLFAALDAEFHFDIDVASTDENALCEKHYTSQDDGLAQEWAGSVWCNPPYGRQIGAWMRKAAETNWGGVTVCLIPARTDTAWWHDWIVGHATEVRFIRGRLKFGDSENSAPFPSAIVVYDKRPRRWWTVCLDYDSYSGTSEWCAAHRCRHVKPRTIEDVLRDVWKEALDYAKSDMWRNPDEVFIERADEIRVMMKEGGDD